MHRRLLLAAFAALALAGCGKSGSTDDPNALSVAATAVPHAEILDFVKPTLAKQGLKLDVRVFNDYVQPNTQVAEGRIAVNYFQTEPYLAEFNRSKGTHLVTIAGVHVEPFGAYSRKWKTLGDLPDGATVAIPNEPSNSGRALQLLAKAGLVTLLDPKSTSATPKDIVENRRNLKFRELEAATLPRVLDQVDLALINTNYALDAGLNPTRDALAIEGKDSPYVNFLVGPESARNDPRVRKLVTALRSPEVRAFIERKYGGAVIPAF
ncbi:MetQ/NlpA family ABC transporter substrate-binding protein [Sphingomonas sp. dw_22]|uniref:MetQ/NlpA family ABC transporter substrate-binding protein n=1 Tax=Sphingomonas sp. dw_22 TaxID=2721175 RepID=UPI001BD6A5E2|nr:MetQ/NlpA family ABC transporter substrate-binding protein [Sphingomonas sp. dw_22]